MAIDKVKALGAQFGAYNGWERANWFARPGDDTSEEATQTWKREGTWFGAVREECLAVRDGVGVLDLPGFSRFHLTGSGAGEWLSGQIVGRLVYEHLAGTPPKLYGADLKSNYQGQGLKLSKHFRAYKA